MALRIYNTLTRQEEDFVPLDRSNVRMYVCGPTVYDYIHIGNARPIVVFDTLFRLLQRLYPKVTYVRNITDVEDKIMDRAAENGESIEALTTRTSAAFHADIAKLNALPPTFEPRATQYIAQMQDLMHSLIDKGHAYVEQGHVLFSVPSMKDYGRLSRHSRDELVAGARVEIAPYKHDAADFVLWKPSTPDQVGWDSPWGRGRPGWHIECSAMSGALLGDTFDIHGGGLDLIFPHHENEIAQSRCAHETSIMARYWMHNGYVLSGNEKMSKSLGNFFTLHELLEEFPGEAVRYLLLSGHYRQPLDFTREGLKRAKASLDRLYGALRWDEKIDYGLAEQDDQAVMGALQADLNTPQALSRLHDIANSVFQTSRHRDHVELRRKLRKAGELVGLLQQDPEAWFKGQAGSAGLADLEIDRLIEQRNAARKAKNFAEADRIRKALGDSGIVLEDAAGGTSWKRG